MKNVYLFRDDCSDQGTFGKLVVPERQWSCFTGELPWRENEKNISCVPDGTYPVVWEYSPKFKRNLYELKEVPFRSECKIHPFNHCGDKSLGFLSEPLGCIAFGSHIGFYLKQKAILNTGATISKFEFMMKSEPFNLIIRSV